MASSMLTLERAHFETLLRRAEMAVSKDANTVTVPQETLSELQETSRRYYNLRQALLSTGSVTPESLDMLSQQLSTLSTAGMKDGENQASAPAPRHLTVKVQQLLSRDEFPASAPKTVARPRQLDTHPLPPHARTGASYLPSPETDGEWDDSTSRGTLETRAAQQRLKSTLDHLRNANRTLLLTNLPVNITYKDVTDVVSGGSLIELWVRPTERSATITFCDPEAAAQFLRYARQHNLFISTRRIDVRWHPQQYQVPLHIHDRIRNGQSRNFKIRNAAGHITEAQIRSDMEHIDRLVIIQVAVNGSDLCVSTNAINLASFARTCMASQARYRGWKIEWYADACDRELVHFDDHSALEPPTHSKTTCRRVQVDRSTALDLDCRNSFAALRSDVDSDEASDTKTSLSGSGIRGPRSRGTEDFET